MSTNLCIILVAPFVSSFIAPAIGFSPIAVTNKIYQQGSWKAPSGTFIRQKNSLFSAIEGTEIVEEAEKAGDRISIQRPAIHWTVPGYKVGWQDREGNWFDADGPRNGPPQNYWRQSIDEGEYNREMAVVDAVLTEFDIESTVKSIEERSSTRLPSLSRKFLGTWAPLLLSGKSVRYNDKPADNEGQMEVPFTIDIYRTNGRKFAPKNHYGLFDLRLSNGEELTISTTGGDDSFSAFTTADESNDPKPLGMKGEYPLQFGGITSISDYVMIQRTPEGAIDVFLRVDDSYLGVSESEAEKYN